MESNNKSFWDSLGEVLGSLFRMLGVFIVILFIIGLITHILDFIKDVFKGNKIKLVELIVWLIFIFFIWYYFPKDNPNYIPEPNLSSGYDTLSGQEIWTEKMKNYDPERGY